MRASAIVWCLQIKGLQVYLFRRRSKDLEKNHLEGTKGFRNLLRPLVESKQARIVKGEVRFANGSKIFLCHLNHKDNLENYQGAEMHLLLIDELTHFTEDMYTYLRGRVRASGLDLPKQYQDVFPRIICGSNPGSIGHTWVKKTFVKSAVQMQVWQTDDDEGGMIRQFIPARLDDNPSMTKDDPTYEKRLKGLKNKALVKALLDGDWDIVAGAFFDWKQDMVIAPFQIPDHWMRFMSYDHGYASPFSVGWWAVSDGTIKGIPRGALVRYREWYGCGEKANKGIRLTPSKIANGILAREMDDEVITARIADPSIFGKQGEKSVANNFADEGIYFIRGKNNRQNGWSQMHSRMNGNEEGELMIYVFNTCLDSIDIIPSAPTCDRNPEDLDTDSEDHICDEWRYGHMYYEYVSDLHKEEEPKYIRVNEESNITMNEMFEDNERNKNDLGEMW